MNERINQMHQTFDSTSTYNFVEFLPMEMTDMLDMGIYHILLATFWKVKNNVFVDKSYMLANIHQSEADGFIFCQTTSTSRDEPCRIQLVVSYQTGLQTIFLPEEEMKNAIQENSITENTLMEERTFLYTCNIHFCTNSVRINEMTRIITSELRSILNRFFTMWDITFPIRNTEVNLHWIPLIDPVFGASNVHGPLLAYNDSILTNLQRNIILYHLNNQYHHVCHLISRMYRRTPYTMSLFELDFGIRGPQFFNVEDNFEPITGLLHPFNNYGIITKFTIQDVFQFYVQLQTCIVVRPSLTVNVNNQPSSSYLYRQFEDDDTIDFNPTDKQIVTRISISTDSSMRTEFQSDVEYGFNQKIRKYYSQNLKIPQSLKRIFDQQYLHAFYLAIEEKLMGPFDIFFFRKIMKLFDYNENIEFKKRRTLVDSYPYNTSQDDLFNFDTIHHQFE